MEPRVFKAVENIEVIKSLLLMAVMEAGIEGCGATDQAIFLVFL